MNDRNAGDHYDEVHVGGHSATVHAGSNYNTYTIHNYYYFYQADPKDNSVFDHEKHPKYGASVSIPAYLGHAAVQSGPNYSNNTYTIANHYYYYGGHSPPRHSVQSSKDSGLDQLRPSESRMHESAARSSRSAPLSATVGHQQLMETDSSGPTVFKQAFDDLTPSARELLNILAFLDPDSVPEEIFNIAIDNKCFKLIKSRDDLRDCYFELQSRQLIRHDTSSKDSYISIHRTVQWRVLLDLSADYNTRWAHYIAAFNIVKAMLPQPDPKAVPEPDVWPPYAQHGRQMLELRTHCLWPEPPVEFPVDFARTLADLGTYMWFSGKFSEGKKVWVRPRASWITINFEGVSERKRSMEFRKTASLSRNEDLRQKPEKDRTRDDEIMLWSTHSDIAFGLMQEEDFEGTALYMEDCLEQYRKWDPIEMAIPYEYAKYYQSMSFCLMAEQKPIEAIKAIARCFDLMKAAAGKTHPMTLLIKFCYANLLWHTETPDARKNALEMNEAVLEQRRQLLGEFSHFTLESYSTCGKLCFDAGELEQARQCLESCLQRRKRAVWNEEGSTRAQFRYVNVLRALAKHAHDEGEEVKAKAYTEDADIRAAEVTKVVQRYHTHYEQYMPVSEDEEANLDQMVSIWAGTTCFKNIAFDVLLKIFESQ